MTVDQMETETFELAERLCEACAHTRSLGFEDSARGMEDVILCLLRGTLPLPHADQRRPLMLGTLARIES